MLKMKNIIKIFPHIIIWTIVLVVPIYFMSKEGIFESKPFYNYVVRIGIFAILFYLNYFYLIEKFLFTRKIALYIVINIVLIAGLVTLQAVISEMMTSTPPYIQEMRERRPKMDGRHPGGPPFMRFIIDYMSIIFVIGLSVAIKMTLRWYRDSINFEKVKRSAKFKKSA